MSRIEMPQPEKHIGIHGFEISSSGYLFKPDTLFEVTNTLNTGIPQEDWIGMEFYPTTDRKVLGMVKDAAGVVGLQLPIPPTIDAEYLGEKQEQYPHTVMHRLHDAFTYNTAETVTKPFHEKGLGRRVRSVLWDTIFGSAQSLRTAKLSHKIGADLNVHMNIIDAAVKENKLDDFRSPNTLLLVENQDEEGRNTDRNPVSVVKNYVTAHNLDGLVYGYDHDHNNLEEIVNNELIQKHLRAIHFSAEDHGLMNVDDPRFEHFVHTLARIPFAHPITVTFDLSPFELKKLSEQEQVDYFARSIGKMRKIQTLAQAA